MGRGRDLQGQGPERCRHPEHTLRTRHRSRFYVGNFAGQCGSNLRKGVYIMKATVIVTLKPTVLDPQGMTIHRNLASLGLTDVTDVRQGKIFSIQLRDGKGDQVERLAREVLTKPVIELYRIIWEYEA